MNKREDFLFWLFAFLTVYLMGFANGKYPIILMVQDMVSYMVSPTPVQHMHPIIRLITT